MEQHAIDFQKVRQYANIELLARQMVEGFITGLHKSPYHGFSVEFAEHRLYNNGESTKHIDWKVYAKTDRLYTKRYEEETNLRCQILIDNSSSMYYPAENLGKISFSIFAAACLSYMLQKQRDAVGISTFSDQIEWQSPVKSTAYSQLVCATATHAIATANAEKNSSSPSHSPNCRQNAPTFFGRYFQ
jgi:uncharacterized protein (DUF58 family)